MTHQRIRIRTDIFQSREFASLKERADGVPLLLPTPVLSSQNDKFYRIGDNDDPEVICLIGNGKDWDYNDNQSFKDLPHNEQSLEGVKKTWLNNCIDFVNGSRYTCSVCQIELMKNNIDSHLKGKKHAKLAERPAEIAHPNPIVEYLKEQILKDEWFKEVIGQHKESTKTKEFIKTKEKPFTFNSSEALIYKSIDFVNGSYSCSVCQIELKERDLFLHLQGKRHAKRRAQKDKDKKEYRLSKKHAVKAKKLATKNEISSRKFLIKEFLNGSLKQLCILCDTVVKSERLINAHFSGQKHKANYERYIK